MDADLLKEFLLESFEGLEQLDNDIVALEKDPSRDDLMPAIFRAIHTIKGGCGFMNFKQLESVAHATETVLGKMRDGSLKIDSDVISDVLQGVDLIKTMLNGLDRDGCEPQVETANTIARLNAVAGHAENGVSAASHQHPKPNLQQSKIGSEHSDSDSEENENVETIAEHNSEIDSQSSQHSSASGNPVENPLKESEPTSDNRQKTLEAATAGSVADLTVRISTTVLDELMNLVGELVLTRNELLQLSRHDQDSQYYNPISQLNRVTTELQEGIMKTRMQPISTVWNKLPRMVRELSKTTGKPLELTLHGETTELDRTVLEAIRDPLTHMLRNSADHGIESPDERVAAGKTRHGNISLSAFHEAGQVIIEVRDDGGGIDRKKVVKRAVERGLVTQASAEKLTDHEILQFIFEPGFSTAEKVTNLSGRGVGMDVVRTAIEEIGGAVEVFSQAGRGTTFKVRIPLTLAIISALLVESEDRTFAIPQVGILELVALNGQKDDRLAWLQDRAYFRRRDRMLPLLRLSDVLGLSAEPFGKAERISEESTIVVVQVDNHHIGLVVDRVLDTEEIVVKPVVASVQTDAIYQGATILGDGQVIMILDSESLVRQEGIDFAALAEVDLANRSNTTATAATSRILLIDAGEEYEIGITLSQVSRLEEFAVDEISVNGTMTAVSYRGDILPLIPLSQKCVKSSGIQPVVVFSNDDHTIGLMVNSIHDIKDAEVELRFQASKPGYLGSALMNDEIIELLNADYFLSQAARRLDRQPVVLVVSENELETRLIGELSGRLEHPVQPFNDVKEALTFLESGRRTVGVLSSIGKDTRAWRTWWSELVYRRASSHLAVSVLGSTDQLSPDIASMLSLADIPVTGTDLDWLFSALQQQLNAHPQKTLGPINQASSGEVESITVSNMDQYVSFTVSGHHFGLPVQFVQEVLIAGGISSVPHLANDVQGLLNLRGQIVTAINLRQRLQLTSSLQSSAANVVVQAPWGAFGLLVDAVGDVVEIPQASKEAIPCTMRPSLRRFATSVARVENNLVTLLDTDKLLNLATC